MTATQHPPRPQPSEHLVLLALETYHADKSNEWDFNDIAENYTWFMDGYDLMRSLERNRYWTGSRDLMEELDEVCFSIEKTIEKAIKEWVIAYRIRPNFVPGEDVVYKGKKAKIIDIEMPTVRYSIQFYTPYSKSLACIVGSNKSLLVNYEHIEAQ